MSSQQTLYVGEATFYPGPPTVNVIAVDAQGGTSNWQTTLAQAGTTEGQSLQIVDRILYASHAVSGSVYPCMITALDAQDGHIIWQYQTDTQLQTQILQTRLYQNVLYLHVLYIQNGEIYSAVEARRVQGAELLWRYATNGTLLFAQCVFTKQIVYLTTCSQENGHEGAMGAVCTIQALRGSDGQRLWQTVSAPDLLRIIATDQTIYAVYELNSVRASSSMQGFEVRALSAQDGSLLWKQTLQDIGDALRDLIVLNNVLYLCCEWQLIALHVQNGKRLWVRQGLYTPGLQTADTLFYALHNHEEFCAFNIQSGDYVWCNKIDDAGSFTIASESVVYTAANFRGKVHALQKSDGHELWSYEGDPGRRVFGLVLDDIGVCGW
jgi:outer membrane protein assembly factor BamB